MQKQLFTYSLTALFLILSVQEIKAQNDPDPRGAFLRSLAVPGWGHYYADKESWNRGKVHLGTDAILIGSIFGLNARTANLQQKYITLSNLSAGVDISNKERSFQLAMGDFNSLHEYNDFQLRSRNWHRLIEDTPENRWQWDDPDDRRRYRELRSNRDRLRNQIPVLGAFMVVNRVISGISAYNRARNHQSLPDLVILPVDGTNGIAAQFNLRF